MYQYDAFGRRITKFNPKTKESIHTLWDGDIIAREVRLHPESQFQEKQKTSTEYWHYQQGSFEPIAKQVETKDTYNPSEVTHQTYFTVTDHIGSPRELFTEDGELAWQGYYETWGKVHTKQTPEKTECNLRYAGQYFDKESGLHYNRHRYYDPESSQYLSPDPIGLSGGLTPQSYVHNPNAYIDPLGLNICKGGKAFKSQHEAAESISKEINPTSISENREYGGMIYQNKDGSYGYTGPIKGSIDGVDPGGPAAVPPGTKATAYWHTHGGPDPIYDNENFSNAYDAASKTYYGDIPYADHYKIDGYLITPSGVFKHYDHMTGKVSILK